VSDFLNKLLLVAKLSVFRK